MYINKYTLETMGNSAGAEINISLNPPLGRCTGHKQVSST